MRRAPLNPERQILLANSPEAITSFIGAEMSILDLCADNSLDFTDSQGTKHTFTPNGTRGYFAFTVSTGFSGPPNQAAATVYGTGIHPAVVSKSFGSMLNQNINYEHLIKLYHKGVNDNVEDRVIGCIVLADFPRAPVNGWKVAKTIAEAPAIKGVGVYFKQTTGMAKIVGDHSTGRHNYTVSMEVSYGLNDSGFAVAKAADGKATFKDTTPEDMAATGWEFVPFSAAPKLLQDTFSTKGGRGRIISTYKGRKAVLLMGGLSNPVEYLGLGVVKYGAEGTAGILRLAASADPAQRAIAALQGLANVVKKVSTP